MTDEPNPALKHLHDNARKDLSEGIKIVRIPSYTYHGFLDINWA